MFPKVNPASTASWKKLTQHYHEVKNKRIADFFTEDQKRFDHFSIEHDQIVFDFSKNLLTPETLSLLIGLCHECKLGDAIEAMFTGEPINETEGRAVLHTALRNFSGLAVYCDGADIMPLVKKEQDKMQKFCSKVHAGTWKGFTGKKIKYIVNIGIGGSDLGPVMVTEALRPYRLSDIQSFFVSNVDAANLINVLQQVSADETLFLIASKTFTTQETMANAHSAKEWFLNQGGRQADVPLHFVAMSTNIQAVTAFGIAEENIFCFWDWVGGRYSLWGVIGLSIALTVGYENYEQLLKGAEHADKHFRQSPYEQNIPVIMALTGIWYRNFFNASTEAILVYDQNMHRFAAYLQQADMESNGKSVDRNGQPVSYQTGPVIWGEAGTNGQHAFYQLIHQGTQMVPCDFIAPAQTHYPVNDHHLLLLSNFFAQTEALMNGAMHDNPNRVFAGNKPTNSFLLKKITPFNLGQLIAYYEHKVFVQGVIWNIYSFDQWGVELGKVLANRILPELRDRSEISSHDGSTKGLINLYKKMK